MKVVKRIIVIAVVGFIVFFLIKPKDINLEGNWEPTKIVINDKDLLSSDPLNRFFDIGAQIVISNWGHYIYITVDQQKISAHFTIENDNKGNNLLILSSREKSLNGKFIMEIDTTDLGPQSYRVDVKLKSSKTYLCFQREVTIPPWKPPFPKKGQV